MIEILAILKGLSVGFLAAIPVGPIGVLCIQRTLDKGRLSGFVSGLGAATADAFYSSIVVFGLVIISDFLTKYQTPIRLIGGIFLIYVGVRSLTAEPRNIGKGNCKTHIFSDYISTFFLTMTNPITVVSFMALFATTIFGKVSSDHFLASLMVLGVFIGSGLWWFILSSGIGKLRSRMGDSSTSVVDKITGIIILFFAVIVIGSLFVNFAL